MSNQIPTRDMKRLYFMFFKRDKEIVDLFMIAREEETREFIIDRFEAEIFPYLDNCSKILNRSLEECNISKKAFCREFNLRPCEL